MLSTTLVLAAALTAPEIAPDAKASLDRLTNFYKNLPGASVNIVMKAPLPGFPEQKTEFKIIKPNQFMVKQDMGPGMSVEIVSDGKTLWTALPAEKQFAQEPAPKTFNDVGEIMMLSGPGSFVYQLFAKDPIKAMGKDVKKIEFGGSKTIKGKAYDVLVLTPKDDGQMPGDIKLELAISKGKDAWLHGGFMNIPAEMTQGMGPLTIELLTQNWKVLKPGEAKLALDTTGWEKLDSVGALLQTSAPEAPGDAEIKAMEGKPAPDFMLKDLDGKTVTLASLRGKTIILDFFATWCGPCKAGMPVLMDIAKARAGDDVELWVVDLDEPADTIKRFLDKQKWTVNLLLTGESDVANDYKVGGIPHTVVIGPDGMIQLIEVGFMGKEHTEKAINQAIDKARAAAKV